MGGGTATEGGGGRWLGGNRGLGDEDSDLLPPQLAQVHPGRRLRAQR